MADQLPDLSLLRKTHKELGKKLKEAERLKGGLGSSAPITIDPNAIQTKQGLVETFETTIVSVRKWTARPDFPGGKFGPWDRTKVDEYLQTNGLGPYYLNALKEAEAGGEGDEPLTVQELRAKIEFLEEKIKGANFRNRKQAESVLDRKEAIQAASEMTLMIKSRLPELSERIGMLVPAEFKLAIMAEVDSQVRTLLKEMAAWRL